MSRIPGLLTAALVALLVQLSACAPLEGRQAGQATRRVAVTFDDLPAISVVGSGIEAEERMTERLLASVGRHRVPAVGFVNEGKLHPGGAEATDPRRVALLRRWLRAGLELGNHSFSHRSLHSTPLAEYQADILRGEVETRRLMAEHGGRPRFFRHPFLHAGRDTATHRALAAFLGNHGYRIAPVTIDNGDYLFAAAYARAGNRGETELQGRIAEAYLAYMDSVFGYYERQARASFGHEIPQVLLLHANQLNADHFDGLAGMMRRRGYEFVTLERALEDPAYRSPDHYVGPGGITWLHRWALTRGGTGAIVPGEPEVPAWVAELASAGR